jgi:TolB-like protein
MSSTSFLNKARAVALACVICGAACLTLALPVSEAAPEGAQKLRIAVLPLVNMSGRPAPVKEMRQALTQGLVALGVSALNDEDLERFMALHRMRYTGGLDTVTAQAFKKETGLDAVLITTLELYTDTRPPAIALTSRLVSVGDVPIILWMDTVGLTGDESPGALGLGLIDDIARLQKKAFDRLTGSFEEFLAGGTGMRTGWGDKRFLPKTVYSSAFMRPGGKHTIAVAPFLNRSGRNDADEFLALHFISQLTKAGTFNVIDPGAVREKLLFFRFIMQEGLSVREADLIHNSLQADFILTGKVMEYRDAEDKPTVEFEALVFERKSIKVVWASWSFNQGDDGVFFFDWRRISTAGELATKMTQAVVRDMVARGTKKNGPPEEQPSAKEQSPNVWKDFLKH